MVDNYSRGMNIRGYEGVNIRGYEGVNIRGYTNQSTSSMPRATILSYPETLLQGGIRPVGSIVTDMPQSALNVSTSGVFRTVGNTQVRNIHVGYEGIRGVWGTRVLVSGVRGTRVLVSGVRGY